MADEQKFVWVSSSSWHFFNFYFLDKSFCRYLKKVLKLMQREVEGRIAKIASFYSITARGFFSKKKTRDVQPEITT